MNLDEVLETYDDAYAHRYDESFLLTPDHGFLAKTQLEVAVLVGTLAAWTAVGGRCFMPVFDLSLFEDRRVRGVLIPGVEVDFGRDRWSFHEPDGKVHRDMLAPPVGMMADMFERHFSQV